MVSGHRTRAERGKLAVGLLVGLVLAVATAGHAIAAPFVITDLGTLGGTFSIATGVNDVGQVVGYSATADGVTHAFLWQSGTMTDLGSLSAAGAGSRANGVNRLGQVVGNSTADDGDTHAFLWQSGTMADLNSLIPADSSWVLRDATAINEAGQLVGWGMNGGQQRAFLWQSGSVTDLGTLGGTSSVAHAINKFGQVVGRSATADGATHAFLWQNGTMIDLGTFNTYSWASGINNLGQVVGTSDSAWDDDGSGWGSNLPHAFLWQDGWMADLHSGMVVIAHESYANALNDSGEIVGDYSDMIFHAMLYPTELRSLIPADSGWVLDSATAINEAGQIVGAGGPGTRAFLLTPSALVSLSLDVTPVADGSHSTGTVMLATTAPEGGGVIAVSSSNPAVATVPATVIVPAGAASATFTISVNSTSASTSVTISATYAGFTASAVLT